MIVAGDHVVNDLLDVGEVGLALYVGADRAGVAARLQCVARRDWRARLQAFDEFVDAELGRSVSGLDVAVEAGVGDDFDHVLEVIEEQDGIDELEERFGQSVRIVIGRLDSGLEVAD